MFTRPPVKANLRSGGFSFLELLIFVVVVSTALLGVLSVINLDVSRSAEALQRKQAIAVAEAFIDEVLTRQFANPSAFVGTPTQINRPFFIDIDDYHLFTSNGIFTKNGQVVSGLTGYSVSISITPSAANTPVSGGVFVTTGEMKRIDVTVTTPSGEPVKLSAYRANI